jgi:hypothetical protein
LGGGHEVGDSRDLRGEIDHAGPITGLHQDRPAAGSQTRLNIREFVTHQKRGGQVKGVPFSSLKKHAGKRFAAEAFPSIGFHPFLRMVGTVVVGIDGGAGTGQLPVKVLVKLMQLPFTVQPPGDTCLVGNDDDQVSGPPEQPDRLRGAGDELEFRGPKNIPVILIDRAVPVQENSSPGVFHQPRQPLSKIPPSPNSSRSRRSQRI